MNTIKYLSDANLLKYTRITKKEIYEKELSADISRNTKHGIKAAKRAKNLSKLLKEYNIELKLRGLKDQEFDNKHDYYIFA